jgi:serpin B
VVGGQAVISRLVSRTAFEQVPPGSPAELAVEHAEQGFALALTQRLLSSAGSSNIVVSPESLGVALTMLELGAAGATQQEIASALGEGRSTAAAQAVGWDALVARLQSDAAASRVQLTDETCLFLQRSLAVKPAYLDALQRYFDTGLERVDFAAPHAAAAVNAWIANSTRGAVPQLFAEPLPYMTELVLTDAVRFAARWAPEVDFLTSLDTPGSFVTASGARVPVTMMKLESSSLAYVSTNRLEAVVLPYAGEGFEAVAVEARGGSLSSVVDSLDSAELTKLASSARVGSVTLTMPKFSISSEANLDETLRAMGIAGAFGLRANYTGITTALGLQLQAIAQADSLTVDERGTDTSSVSGVRSGPTLQHGHIETISFDHPFLFVIRDRATGAIVSDAIVADPGKS